MRRIRKSNGVPLPSRGDVFGDDGVRADATAVTEVDRAEDFCAGPDEDLVAHGGVAFDGIELHSAQGDPMKNNAVVADFGRFTNDDAHAVIDHQASAKRRPRVNFYAREPAAQFTKKTGNEKEFMAIKKIRHTMKEHGLGTRIEQDDLQIGFGGRIVIPIGFDEFKKMAQ